MARLLRMSKSISRLGEPFVTKVQSAARVEVRPYQSGDAAEWIRLRSLALPSAQASRPWTEQDFAREFLTASWWRPDQMLMAVLPEFGVVGTVTIRYKAYRRAIEPARSEANLRWLLVDPNHQRQGIATKLVDNVERMSWEKNCRRIWLETLSSWTAAVAFYTKSGYEVA